MQAYIYWAIAYNLFMIGTAALFYAYLDRDYMQRRNPKVVLLMSFTAAWNVNPLNEISRKYIFSWPESVGAVLSFPGNSSNCYLIILLVRGESSSAIFWWTFIYLWNAITHTIFDPIGSCREAQV